ncbi:MAG TPA: SH3 domain-containing protein [Melioribacteraceae bacterium]|nr:SH3 domain-containing protein [Melioribacteraceae bacterium]
MNKKIGIISGGAVILLILGYFVYQYLNNDLSKVIKNLNAQNWDMAIANLKEIIFDDETNSEAKALLVYAQTRKYFDEHNISKFDHVIYYGYESARTLKQMYYYNVLNEKNYLKDKDREFFLMKSKDIRKFMLPYGINTENFDEIVGIIKNLCELGAKEFKLNKGDEVDLGIYALLLAGNSFFGDIESGKELIRIARLHESAQRLLVFCDQNIKDDLEKEITNEQSLLNEDIKSFLIPPLLKPEIEKILSSYNRVESAKDNLNDQDSYLYGYFYPDFVNNSIFFNQSLFESYLQSLEKYNKTGIDVKYIFNDKTNIIAIYGYLPKMQKYFTKVFNYQNRKLSTIKFNDGQKETEVIFTQNMPLNISFEYNDVINKQYITLYSYKKTIKYESRMEEFYNQNTYRYEFRETTYPVEDVISEGNAYILEGNTGMLINNQQLGNETIQSVKKNQNYYENYTITGNGVRVRVAPSLDAGIMFQLYKGTIVKGYETIGNWLKIEYNGKQGYVSLDFVESEGDI